MKMASFLLGLFLIFLGSLVWWSSAPEGIYEISSGEFTVVFFIGFLLALPELVYEIEQLLSSSATQLEW